MAECKHVVPLLGWYEERQSLCLVMPQYAKSLRNVLDAAPDRKLPEMTALRYASVLFEGLLELGEAKIIHRVSAFIFFLKNYCACKKN